MDQATTLPNNAIVRIPHQRNPNFTGRSTLLSWIDSQFATKETVAPRLVLHGLGGVGKTQIANEYLYKFSDSYKLIWWIRSEELGKISDDFAELALALQLDGAGHSDRSSLIEAVRRELEDRREWLLIFDNAERPEDLSAVLPRRGGNVLVTSRNPNWGEIAIAPVAGLGSA